MLHKLVCFPLLPLMCILPRILGSLQILNLSRNALEELPPSLFHEFKPYLWHARRRNFRDLRVIDLSYNKLSILAGHGPSNFECEFEWFPLSTQDVRIHALSEDFVFFGAILFSILLCTVHACIFGATYGGLRSTCLLTSVIFRSMCGFFKRPRHLGFWALQHSKPQSIGPAWKSIDQGDPVGFVRPGRWMLQTTPKLRWAVDGLNRFLSSVSRIWWKLLGFLSLKKFILLKRSLVFEELSKNNLMWHV